MSSDEDNYDNRAHRRTRRRGYDHARRRGKFDGYYGHKLRRSGSSFSRNGARLAAAAMFFLLLCYEVIILKGPLSGEVPGFKPSTVYPSVDAIVTRRISSSSKARLNAAGGAPSQRSPPTEQRALPPPPPVSSPAHPAHVKLSVDAATTASEVAADGDDNGDSEENVDKSKSDAKPIVRDAANKAPMRQAAEAPTHSSLSKKKKRGGAAFESGADLSNEKQDLTANAADSDFDDVSDTPANKQSSSHSSKATSPGKQRSKKKSTSLSNDDIEPPPPRVKQGTTLEKGADPGANENFWKWFQDNKGNEKKGASTAVKCPDENQRLCQMVYKFVRKYKIRSIYDVSCTKNVDWMTVILKQASSELWGFKYYCSEPDEEKMANTKRALADFKFVEFASEQWWREGFVENVELVLSWDTLAHTAYGRVWNFFVNIKKQNIKYLLVDNYPGVLNDPVSCCPSAIILRLHLVIKHTIRLLLTPAFYALLTCFSCSLQNDNTSTCASIRSGSRLHKKLCKM